MSLFSKIFNYKNDTFILAKNSLDSIKTKLINFSDNFPDVTIPELLFISNKWSDLPEKLGSGVSVLGLDLNKDYSSLLAVYKKDGFILPHEHKNEYELNRVIKGTILNKITGELFKAGQTFTINKNQKHYLVAKEESYLYCIITPNKELLKKPRITQKILSNFKQFSH
jgi:quercetin dioxygenase-like cupin family protein